ncbi:hypothetical protein [Halalkalicoccus tibetensis]|uniref:7-cyano-7-deazaguanine synthase (Queuosine biosynthesis) n=1 Tax=Halalkalicoccus tibetensis TaxID=175632 RepID=A0ABD5V6J3_9EURY
MTDVDPYVRYSQDVSEVPEGVLAVPLLSTLCPVAWITGSDLYIEEVDATFLRALPGLQRAFAELYPDAPFAGSPTIHYKDGVDNESRDDVPGDGEAGVLFTGGVDSTTTYLQHREKRPHLISVRKESETRANTWKLRRPMIEAFAEENDLRSHFVETNLKLLFDKFMLNLYYRHLLNDSWDRTMYFGLGYPGFTAPITYLEGITELHQSVDYLPHDRFPNSARPRLVENLRWADTVVESGSVGLTRQDKIERIGDYFAGKDTAWRISSCDEGGESSLCCNECGTCLHTIIGFIVAGYDPADYGFDVDEGTFDRVKAHLNEQEFHADSVKARFWLELQDRADPDRVDHSPAAVEFVEWFADAPIAPSIDRPLPPHEPNYEASLKRRLCITLPYPLDAAIIDRYFEDPSY